MKFAEIGGYLSTWYRVCTNAIFTSEGSYGNVEPKTLFRCKKRTSHYGVGNFRGSRIAATHFIIQRHCTGYPFRERFEVFEHVDKRGLTPLQMLIEEMPGKKNNLFEM